MLRFRPDLSHIAPYRPGRPIIEVAAEYGISPDQIVKLASNESPFPPMAVAREAIIDSIDQTNRYPDNDARILRRRLAEKLGVENEAVWVAAGSSEVLRVVATALGGPGTSAVYAWPSFVVYRIATRVAHAQPIEVPLTPEHGHDLEAMPAAIQPSTTVVYVCNPNNPTGAWLDPTAITRLVDRVPEDVLVVIDEAYHEFVTHPDHRSALPLALERPNVLVSRTFSKVYGLAALRVGYAVTRPETIAQLRRVQAPFSVTDLGQVAAVASLTDEQELRHRIEANASVRGELEAGLARLGLEYVPSQANFVYFRLGAPTETVVEAFVRHGVVLRPFGDGWVRVSVGTGDENRRFLSVLAEEKSRLQTA